MAIGEFELIGRYFGPHEPGRADTVLGIGDDCALMRLDGDSLLAVSVDTLVAGVHFFPDVDPARLGHKALAVNLSDLAAMGAEPLWLTLALTLPAADPEWLQAFSTGFLNLARVHGTELVGGDTTRGPLSITVQVMGKVPQGLALRRSGAGPGDAVYVSGSLGDAGLGLQMRRGIWTGPAPEAFERLEMPIPRIALGLTLRGLVSACIDVSDGLAADLGHILEASGVGAEIEVEQLPLSAPVKRYLADTGHWELPLTAGDDYELCFTAPASAETEILRRAAASGCSVTRIGRILKGRELRVLRHGQPVELASGGFRHF